MGLSVSDKLAFIREYKKQGGKGNYLSAIKQYVEGGEIIPTQGVPYQAPTNQQVWQSTVPKQPVIQPKLLNLNYQPNIQQDNTNIPNSQNGVIYQIQKDRDYQTAIDTKSEIEFKTKYGTSPHRYKYDTDAQYKAQVDRQGKASAKDNGAIDLPSTDLRRKDVVNPANMWMYPQLTGESNRQASNFSNEIISAVLPIPGVDKLAKGLKYIDNAFIPELQLFKQSKNSLTRGIGTNKVGIDDLYNSGIVRGNPRGRILSPKEFKKTALQPSMQKFKKKYPDTYENIASNNLSEKEYELVHDFFSKNPIYSKGAGFNVGTEGRKVFLKRESVLDNFKESYPTYDDYLNQNASANYIDSYSDGTPMAFWYENGQFPNYQNYPSKYFLKLNKAGKYNPKIPSGHLHPTTEQPIRLGDPNLELYETIKNWRGKKLGKLIELKP